jgi:hypothetical protein
MNTIASDPGAVTPDLVPLTKLDTLRQAGAVYPETIDGWRWLYRTRKDRGMEAAFRRVGRRILVDVPAYLAAVRAQPS